MVKKLSDYPTLEEKCIAIVECLGEKMSGHGYHMIAYQDAMVDLGNGKEQTFGFIVINEEGEKLALGLYKVGNGEVFDPPFDTVEFFAESVVHTAFHLISERTGIPMKYAYFVDNEVVLEDDLTDEEMENNDLAYSDWLPRYDEMGNKPIKDILIGTENGLYKYTSYKMPFVDGYPIEMGDYVLIHLFDVPIPETE